MRKCQYCGRELKCIGGWYYPVYEECPNGCDEKARREAVKRSVEFSRRVREKQDSCSHEWHKCVQDNYAYERCSKCDATRPVGGGSW